MARKSSVISVLIQGDNRGLSGALDDSSSRLANFGKKAGVALAAVGAAAGVAAFAIGRSAVSAASDLEESINAVNVAFGAAAEGVLKIGLTSATAMGVSRNEFNAAAVRFSAFADRVVGDGGDVAGFISEISVRAADFASVFNIEVAEALQVFQSGLAGEAEPLKRFGINMLQAEVQAFALESGLISVGQQMTEQQKVQARFGLLMRETAKTAGDFANTSDGLANSQRILKSRIDDIMAALGTGLLPVVTSLVSAVADKAVPAFERFAEFFKRNEAVITDFGKRVLGGIETAVGFIGDRFDELRPIIGTVVDFIRTKTGEFRTFFEERVQGPVDVALARIKTFATDAKAALSGLVSDLQPSLQGFVDFFRNLDFDDPAQLGRNLGVALGTAIRDGLQALSNLGGEVSDALGRLFDGVDYFDLGKRQVSNLAVFALGFATALLSFEWFEPVLAAIRDNLGEVLLAAIGIALAPVRVGAKIGAILARIPLVGTVLQFLVKSLQAIGKPFRDGFELIFTSGVNAFLRAIRAGGPTLTARFTEFLMILPRAIRGIGDTIVLNISFAVQRLTGAFGTSLLNAGVKIRGFLSTLIQPFTSFGKTLGDDLFAIGKNVIDALIRGLGSMAGVLKRTVQNIGRSVFDTLSKLWRISSPSKVFMNIGEEAMQGLALGLAGSERMLRDLASGVGTAALPSIDVSDASAVGSGDIINITVTSADPQAVVEALRRYTRANGPLGQVVSV